MVDAKNKPLDTPRLDIPLSEYTSFPIVSKRTLQLLPRIQHNGPHLAIDLFFRSLAQDQNRQAIGVLLSGTASDGTMGLQVNMSPQLRISSHQAPLD